MNQHADLFGIEIGTTVTFSKTVGESDVYLFAGITGDLSPNHVDEEFMKGTPYGRRIAHGVLALGYASTTSSMLVSQHNAEAVSYGYDRVRFIAPIFLGDTVSISYCVTELDEAQAKSYADVTITNQEGTVCMVAKHIMKYLSRDEGAEVAVTSSSVSSPKKLALSSDSS